LIVYSPVVKEIYRKRFVSTQAVISAWSIP